MSTSNERDGTGAVDIERIKQQKLEITRQFGPWIKHNIRIVGDTYTIDKRIEGDEIKLRRVVQVASDLAGEPLKNLRILDLACQEGLYAIEFARRGAQVVALEGRQDNIEKAKFVKEACGIDNLDIYRDDVRNLSKEKYGTFDIVLCLGILYHLDAPDVFQFMENIAAVCQRFAIIDTHISLKDKFCYSYRGKKYWGRLYVEHEEEATPEAKRWALSSSLDNSESFWLTRASLYNLLSHVGFTSVFACQIPSELEKSDDRLTLVAYKGRQQTIVSAPLLSGVADDWPEKRQIKVHACQEDSIPQVVIPLQPG